MTDTTTPGAPAPIPDPKTTDGVLLTVGRSFLESRRILDEPSFYVWRDFRGKHYPGNWDDKDAILLHLIDRVRAAEARVAELEAALPRALNGDVILPGSFIVRRFDMATRVFVDGPAVRVGGKCVTIRWGGAFDVLSLSDVLSAHPTEDAAKAEAARLNAAREAEEMNHD